ncbi:MAG TPA: hypothetical protein VF411_01840 [Bacteroidia bacterium]
MTLDEREHLIQLIKSKVATQRDVIIKLFPQTNIYVLRALAQKLISTENENNK